MLFTRRKQLRSISTWVLDSWKHLTAVLADVPPGRRLSHSRWDHGRSDFSAISRSSLGIRRWGQSALAMETVERKGNMDDQMGNMKELSTQYSLMLNLLENLENPKQFRNSQHLRLRFGLSGVPYVHRDASKYPWPVHSALKLLDFVRILWMGLSLPYWYGRRVHGSQVLPETQIGHSFAVFTLQRRLSENSYIRPSTNRDFWPTWIRQTKVGCNFFFANLDILTPHFGHRRKCGFKAWIYLNSHNRGACLAGRVFFSGLHQVFCVLSSWTPFTRTSCFRNVNMQSFFVVDLSTCVLVGLKMEELTYHHKSLRSLSDCLTFDMDSLCHGRFEHVWTALSLATSRGWSCC